VQVQVLLSAPLFVKMKNVLLLLLCAVFLSGCMHRYDLTMVNGMKVTRISKPKLDRQSGLYSYKNIKGEKRVISASQVVEIAPHKEPKPPKKIKTASPS
jgi:hypothetical protein